MVIQRINTIYKAVYEAFVSFVSLKKFELTRVFDTTEILKQSQDGFDMLYTRAMKVHNDVNEYKVQ